MVVIALVLFFDLVQPEYADFEQTKGTLAGENQLYQTESQAVNTAKKIIAQFQQQVQGEQTVGLAMPTREDIAGALAQVYGLAASNGVNVQGVSISSPTIQPAPAGGTTGAATKPIGSFSLQVSAVGSYESMTSLISGLETNIRVFDVKNISLAPAQTNAAVAKGAPVTQDLFTYNITVITYYQTN